MSNENHGERLATLEADIDHIRAGIERLQHDFEKYKEGEKSNKNNVKGWVRGIGIGIVVLFVTSGLNFMIWLINKVGL